MHFPASKTALCRVTKTKPIAEINKTCIIQGFIRNAEVKTIYI